MLKHKELLTPYNPWWADPKIVPPKAEAFHRPLFQALMEGMERIPQMLSLTGPRRIGKSTLLHQMIAALLKKGVPPERLVYYSFDDPALERLGKLGGAQVIEDMMRTYAHPSEQGPAYLFLDEIQRLDRWELYLKKYYDLTYPIRVVISGSASSPIYKRSRESLLGRVKDYHLLPFSFREVALFQLQDEPDLLAELRKLHDDGTIAQALMTGDHRVDTPAPLNTASPRLQARLDQVLRSYFLEGGFPEVWSLKTWVDKQDYLYDNQVKKVIYEDLVLAAEFRKPELLKRFYVSLLEIPGQEASVQGMAAETGVSGSQIEKYLPLLEMTDLVYHVDKFRKGALRVRKGKMKFYLVDLALRNAVLRLTETLLEDEATLGHYAENLVYLALRKLRGAIQVDYYRERDGEVDFVVHTGPRWYAPIEVKYQNQLNVKDIVPLKRFAKRYGGPTPLLVTKRWEQFGTADNVLSIPLPLFLVLID